MEHFTVDTFGDTHPAYQLLGEYLLFSITTGGALISIIGIGDGTARLSLAIYLLLFGITHHTGGGIMAIHLHHTAFVKELPI